MKFVVKYHVSVLTEGETREEAIKEGRIEVMKNPSRLIAIEVSRDPVLISDIRKLMEN